MRIIGTDRRSLPVEVRYCQPVARFPCVANQGRLDVLVVLIERDGGQVVAYRGSGGEEWIMRHGDKLTQAEAEAHFPGMATDLKARGLTYCL